MELSSWKNIIYIEQLNLKLFYSFSIISKHIQKQVLESCSKKIVRLLCKKWHFHKSICDTILNKIDINEFKSHQAEDINKINSLYIYISTHSITTGNSTIQVTLLQIPATYFFAAVTLELETPWDYLSLIGTVRGRQR